MVILSDPVPRDTGDAAAPSGRIAGMEATATSRGATLDADGTLHVAVPAAASAEAVQLCLLDDDGGETRVDLAPDEGGWRGSAAGVTPGRHYGFRVHGPWDPARGVRTNPAKLLVDPWARRVTGTLTDLAAARAHDGDPFSAAPSGVDSAPGVPHAVVAAPRPAAPRPGPGVPWTDTVIYETHVRDLTMRHPEVPEALRGTYLGVAHPAVVAHLVGLGVTTVELLPVSAAATEPALFARGRRNHWGYSTLAHLAPEPRYAAVPGEETAEVAAMVDALHAAGLEVVVDVVFNHTCEGDVSGPSLSWRGLDAGGWYALDPDGRDVDLSGCGNTLDAGSPLVAALTVDALRHWVLDLGVDGFRFDLASTLGRPGGGAFDPAAPLLAAIAADDVLSRVKLIAEPWDATGEGYRVGGFGPAWAEWNGRFRDGVRDFWRGHGPLSEIVTRVAGSSDLYGARGPWASVGFVTAHDGFTLRDLVSHERKHNDANGEDGRDGTDDNRSANHGVEGPTDDPAVAAVRDRQARNLLATLALSVGTPMLLGGDELGHTQHGNNNAYCLDDETSWRAWDGPGATDLTAYVTRVLALRADVGLLRRPAFLTADEVTWLDASGAEPAEADWPAPASTLVVRLADARPLLLVLHAGPDPVEIVLPDVAGERWWPVLDSGTPDGAPADTGARPAGAALTAPGRSFLAYRGTAPGSGPGA